MCRNIKPLFNFAPKASEAEIHDAALQFIRKVTGMQKPSADNEAAFLAAIKEVTHTTQHLFQNLHTTQKPKNREEEAEKAKLRNAKRFG